MVDGLPEATLRDSFKPHGSDINGIWSDGTTIWVVDDEFHNETTETIRAYRKSDKVRDAEKDITSLTIRFRRELEAQGHLVERDDDLGGRQPQGHDLRLR